MTRRDPGAIDRKLTTGAWLGDVLGESLGLALGAWLDTLLLVADDGAPVGASDGDVVGEPVGLFVRILDSTVGVWSWGTVTELASTATSAKTSALLLPWAAVCRALVRAFDSPSLLGSLSESLMLVVTVARTEKGNGKDVRLVRADCF